MAFGAVQGRTGHQARAPNHRIDSAIQAALRRARSVRDADDNIAIVDNAAVLSGSDSTLDQNLLAERVVAQFGLLHIRNEISVDE